MSPEWIPESGGRVVEIAELVTDMLADERVDGLTFSGGEPMRQAGGVRELLDQVDVLIDGTYVAARNSGRGMRGSANQVVHHLTGRLADHDFENGERRVELRVRDRDVLVVGVPPHGLLSQLDSRVPVLR